MYVLRRFCFHAPRAQKQRAYEQSKKGWWIRNTSDDMPMCAASQVTGNQLSSAQCQMPVAGALERMTRELRHYIHAGERTRASALSIFSRWKFERTHFLSAVPAKYFPSLDVFKYTSSSLINYKYLEWSKIFLPSLPVRFAWIALPLCAFHLNSLSAAVL